jgi:hypothetical protein
LDSDLAIRFASSAGRHGIGEDRIRYVITHAPVVLFPTPDDDGEPDRILFLGPDRQGSLLEVVALELAPGDLLVIHAMRMRRKYRDHYLMVLRWQEPQ